MWLIKISIKNVGLGLLFQSLFLGSSLYKVVLKNSNNQVCLFLFLIIYIGNLKMSYEPPLNRERKK